MFTTTQALFEELYRFSMTTINHRSKIDLIMICLSHSIRIDRRVGGIHLVLVTRPGNQLKNNYKEKQKKRIEFDSSYQVFEWTKIPSRTL